MERERLLDAARSPTGADLEALAEAQRLAAGDPELAAALREGEEAWERSTRNPSSNGSDKKPVIDKPPVSDVEEAKEKPATTLPEEFWSARAVLEHIRTAARSRLVAPDALLAATLARVAVLTDHRVMLPAIIGTYGTLNLMEGIVGPPGAGKGAVVGVSGELVPSTGATEDYKVGEVPAGSGEGMVHAFYEKVAIDDNGRKTELRRRWHGVLVRCDEGQVLNALAQRTGQTTFQTLRQAFSGETLGGSYATGDKRVTLASHDYRFVMLMAVQPVHARAVLNDHAGGTPQRFLWLAALDPTAPDVADVPDWPGELPWSPMLWTDWAEMSWFGFRRGQVEVDPTVVLAIRRHHQAVNAGTLTLGTFDGHRNYVQLKVAALLGVLDLRYSVTVQDWQLAGMVLDTSDAVRQAVLDDILTEEVRVEAGRNARAGTRAAAEWGAQARAAAEVRRVAGVIARAVHKQDRPFTRSELNKAVRSTDRGSVDVDLAIHYALEQGWLKETDDGRYIPGESKPA